MDQSNDESLDIEYSVETDDDYLFDYSSNNISVVGEMKKAVRYNLKKLMESNTPKHKEILKSLVINAAEKNLYTGFKCLLHKNYQVGPLNEKNQTALHLAFYNGSKGIISEFSNYLGSEHCQEPDQTNYTDIYGLTHLHVACAMGSSKLIDYYSQNKANINARFVSPSKFRLHHNGFTPLHFFMINHENCNKNTVELLVKRGADVNAVDDLGRTALHIISGLSNTESFSKNTLEVMKVLIDYKADANAKDAKGNTPLFVVFPSSDELQVFPKNQNDFTKLIEQTEQKVKLLLEGEADLNAKNNNNDTVLHFAMGFLKILRKLFRDSNFGFNDSRIIKLLQLLVSTQQVDVNVKNNNDQTPLVLAISYLSIGLVKFFLKHSVNLDCVKFNHKIDEFFNYPYGVLTLEPLQNLIDILELLLSEGCILDTEDNLAVLKFLTCDVKSFGLNNYDFKSDIFHMMCIESSKHVRSVLDNFFIDFDYDHMNIDDDGNSGYPESSEDFLDYYDNLHAYLFCINAAKVHVNKASKASIKATLNKCKRVEYFYNPGVEEEDIYEELDSLESIMLTDDTSMIDVLMNKPEKTVLCFGQSKFDKTCLENLDYFEGIVKGHVTLCLIRYYVIKLSYEIVKNLHCTPLPHICYELITKHLTNKDILNLCLAVVS